MNIHEYQAKALLAQYGIPIPRGKLVGSAREASRIAEEFGGAAVVKAQIHAGGRGAAGGVRLAKNPKEAADQYVRLLGSRLTTRQTGPEGRRVRKIYIEESQTVERELYLAVALDRKTARPLVLASSEGGIGVEEARDSLLRVSVDPAVGLSAYSLRGLAAALELTESPAASFPGLIRNLYRLFQELDCSLVEINPLAIMKERGLVALDAKIRFDDNALFRHPDILELRDFEEESPEEFEASKRGLSYVRLDGSIGCLVNGAGLAMATLDAIAIRGGTAANFLDLGGGVRERAVTAAFKLLLDDRRTSAVLVNVFGGIVRCDEVAAGIARAVEETPSAPPVVARLSGNRSEEGRTLLRNARLKTGNPLDVRFAGNMEEAARLAVAAAAR